MKRNYKIMLMFTVKSADFRKTKPTRFFYKKKIKIFAMSQLIYML